MTRKTITDVAQAAGVAIKTVSRVLNNEPRVRPATRERVMAAVKALNYFPSVAARGLAGRTRGSLLSTRETVLMATPAAFATSVIVLRLIRAGSRASRHRVPGPAS